MAWRISSARCFFSSTLRARLVSGLSCSLRHHIPNRLRKNSCKARPIQDADVRELWVLGRSFLMSTRHFLIRTEAGSSGRLSGQGLLFRRLRLVVFDDLGVFFRTGVGRIVLFSDGFVSLFLAVMMGTVVEAVCMGSAGSSMVCRLGPGTFLSANYASSDRWGSCCQPRWCGTRRGERDGVGCSCCIH